MDLKPRIVPEIRFRRKHDANRVRLLLSRSMPLVKACTLLSFLHNYIKVDETLETQKRQAARRNGFYRHASSYDGCDHREQPSERDTLRPLLGYSPRSLRRRAGRTTSLETKRKDNITLKYK